MIYDDETEAAKAKILNQEEITIMIPQCCREGWSTCAHVPKPQRKEKQNIAV